MRKSKKILELESKFGSDLGDLLKKLYVDEKKPSTKIAELLGISSSSVYGYLRNYEIQVRDHSESMLDGKQRPSEDQLVQLYLNENKSSTEIAKMFGITNTSVRNYLKECGISVKTISEAHLRGKQKPSEDQLRQLYMTEKKSAVEIGEILNIYPSTVRKWLRNYEIPVRNNSEAQLSGKQKPSEDQLRQLYIHENKSSTKIAKLFGITHTSVNNYLRAYGIPVRTNSEARLNGKLKPSVDQLRQLYLNKKKTTCEIGEMFGISDSTIRNYLNNYKIPVRTLSEVKLKGKQKLSVDQLRQLYINEKKTTYEIGEMFNVDSTSISGWLKEYKIPIRNQDSSNELKRQALERVIEEYLK